MDGIESHSEGHGPGQHRALDTARAALWALCGAAVVLFVFFAAIGGIDPVEAWVATVVVAALAALWVVHAVLSRRAGGPARNRPDRERRGF